MTTILAIDTATGPCSVAIWDGGRVAAYVENAKPVMQSASLMPMVEEALSACGKTYRDVTRVACTVGPGSFTGIRVGLAAARGIAFAAGIPAAGFTTLEVLAFAARAQGPHILAILNAGKGEWYWQPYVHGKAGAEAAVGPLETAMAFLKTPVIAGNAPGGATVTFPRADALAELAAVSGDSQALRPFYIRAPDAKLPTKNF